MRIIYPLWIVMLLLCSIMVTAEYKELVHDGWHTPGETFKFKTDVFDIGTTNDPMKMGIKINGKGMIILKGRCRKLEFYLICLDGVLRTDTKSKYTGKLVHQYKVSVSRYLARMVINRKVFEDNLNLGELQRVETTIENIGSDTAKDVYYIDPYDPYFEISRLVGCFKKNNSVIWFGDIPEGLRKECSYTLVARESGKQISIANVTYYDGKERKFVESFPHTTTIGEYGLELRAYIFDDQYQAGDRIPLKVTLKNTNKRRAFEEVDLSIYFPPEIEIISEDAERLGSRMRLVDDLPGNTTHYFNFTLVPKGSGNFAVDVIARYTAGNKGKEEKKTIFINIKSPRLKVEYVPFDVKLLPGEQVIINATLVNPSHLTFNDVSIKLQTSIEQLTLQQQKVFRLLPREKKNIVEHVFTAPNTSTVFDFWQPPTLLQ